jgi:dTDP-glucose 4,6-dehydratase
VKLVVITGCLGLIGSHVTRACLLKGWKVYGIDKRTYAADPHILEEFLSDSNFTFLKKDIALIKHIPDCDYVINLAAESHVGNSIIDSSAFMETNINGVKNLLDLIRQKPDNVDNRPVFFHFSTDEVYGDIEFGAHSEEDILKPSNPYSASKAAADMLVLAWARTYGLQYIIIRPTNNYGPNQYPEKLIPLSVKLLMRSKKIRLHNEGTPVRNWLHSYDTAAAVVRIIESGSKNKIYNVSGGYEQTNRETVEKIIKAFHGPTAEIEKYVDLTYERLGQDVRYALNDDKLRELGWQPKKLFDEEIHGIVKFYKENFKW